MKILDKILLKSGKRGGKYLTRILDDIFDKQKRNGKHLTKILEDPRRRCRKNKIITQPCDRRATGANGRQLAVVAYGDCRM